MWQNLFAVFKGAVRAWLRHKANRLAAALAFYVMLSFSPLLVASVGVATLFVGRMTAVNEIIEQINLIAGPVIQEAAANFIENSVGANQRVVAGSASLLILFYGASNVFNQLQDAFNTIWEVQAEGAREGLWLSLKRRLIALLWVLAAGLVITILVLVSTLIVALNAFLTEQVADWLDGLLPLFDVLFSLFLLSALFAFMYKTLPQTAVLWRDVYWGASLTAVLFIIGKYALSFYLSWGTVGSAYGAAGSLVVILVWVYYSGMIFLFGAEFTRAYALRFGSRRPTNG